MSGPLFADVKAIFFDLDDTLCRYWEAARAGLLSAFEKAGPPGYTAEDLHHHWSSAFKTFLKEVYNDEWYPAYLKNGGTTRTEQMRRMLAAIDLQDEDRAIQLSQIYMQERDARLQLFDDALEVLDCLKGRYKLGIITNGPADVQRQEIETLKIAGYFDSILIEGEMGEGKPKLTVFRRAEESVGSDCEHTLFVGNSYSHDIRPAIEAGWKTAWIRRPTDVPPSAGPTGSAVESKPDDAPEADVTIVHLTELVPLLGL